MIECPVCNVSNHHLTAICTSCGAYLQTRADNLDLFQTAWNVLEKPKKTFHTIAVARHKNYSFILSAVSGFAFIFFIFWLINAGEYTNSLLNFLAAGITIGPPLGILTILLLTVIFRLLFRIASVRVSFRNLLSVVAYTLVPIVISVLIVLPIEVMTFGLYFFTKNPSPYLLNPLSYVMLLVLDSIFVVWSLVLCAIGLRTLSGRGWIGAIVFEVIALGSLAGIFYSALTLILPILE